MVDIYGRTGGPYLDQVELEATERRNATAEGREPDFSLANLLPLVHSPAAPEAIPESESPVLADPGVPSETAFGPGIKLSEAPQETFRPIETREGKSP